METTIRRISTAELVSAAVLALTCADAEQLERLARLAPGCRPLETAKEQRVTQQGMRTFGALIAITRRNLRVLRGAGGYRRFPE